MVGGLSTVVLATVLGAADSQPAAEEPAAESLRAAERLHIVVLPVIEAREIDAKLGELLDEVLLAELAAAVPEGSELLGASDVKTMLDFEEQKQLAGTCEDSSCLAEIGAALGASHLVVPTLGLLGEQYVVGLKLIVVAEATVIHRKLRYVEATETALLGGVRQEAAVLASAQGWQAAEVEADRGSGLFWPGIALGGVGLAAAIGLGAGAMVADSGVDASSAYSARQTAAFTAIGLAAGSGLGLLASAAGGMLVGLAVTGD